MPESKRPAVLRALAAAAVLLALACGPCSLLGTQSPTPPRPVVESTEAARQLESRVRQSLSSAPGQQFILTVTDSELTSLAAMELAQYDESPISGLQLWFTKGKVYGTGRLVNVLPIEADFFLVTQARVEDGQVSFEIQDASAGDLPLPDRVLEFLSQSLNETVAELGLDVEVSSLEILEGEAIIQGVRR